MVQPAHLILHSGRIWDGGHVDGVDSIAVGGGRILSIGSRTELEGLRSEATTTIDVGGRRIIPGLIDSHLHMVRAGLRWNDDVHWHDLRSLSAALERLTAAAASGEPGRWLAVMGGWHPDQFDERRPPTRRELDEAAPANPVFVQRNYIEACLNSAALEEVGWDTQGDGRATGPAALQELRARLEVPSHEEQVAGTMSLLRDLSQWGLTGCIDAGGFGMVPSAYQAINEVHHRGDLGFRARLLVGAAQPGAETGQIESWMSEVEPGSGDDRLRNLGAGEVLLFAAHDMEGLDNRDISGTRPHLAELTRWLAGSGWTAHLHAILDTSVSTVLDAWESLGDRSVLADLRWAITHADQVTEATLRRIRELGVGLTIQNGMAFRGRDSTATWGEGRVTHAPPLRTMIELGIPVGAGTDGTVVSSPNPWPCIWWMVTGNPLDGAGSRVPEQRLTVDQALALYTSGSAWFSFEEGSRGNLRPGSHADLAVLSEDPLHVPEDRIRSIRSSLTMVAGEVVHNDL